MLMVLTDSASNASIKSLRCSRIPRKISATSSLWTTGSFSCGGETNKKQKGKSAYLVSNQPTKLQVGNSKLFLHSLAFLERLVSQRECEGPTFFRNDLSPESRDSPSMRLLAAASASSVSSNFLKALSFTLQRK